jgi:hypothetical protein
MERMSAQAVSVRIMPDQTRKDTDETSVACLWNASRAVVPAVVTT